MATLTSEERQGGDSLKNERSDAAAPVALPPLEGAARIWGTLALSAAVFMNVLDTSIANVSLPAIAGDLGVSANQGTWVITSFAVANAIAVPLTGWLSQRFGQVRLFIISVALFVLSSWLCGMAPNMTMLIAFRVLQGLVAGPMIPLSQALLLSSYPRALAGLAMAMWSMTTLIAPVTGPLLGGWITDNMTWPWIFYINVPVGIASVLVTWAIFRERETKTRKLPIDSIGLALLVVWVAAMQIMLDIGKEHDWFQSPTVVVCAVVAVVGLIYFVMWEQGEEHPIVDLSLFKVRNFWAGTLAISVGYGLFFGNVVLLPLWLQQFMGYTATNAGMVMAPVGLLALVLSPFVGKTIGRVDPRWYATFAFLIFALVLWMRSRFNTQVDVATLMIPTVIQGVSMAFFFIPLITLTMSGLSPERIPAASGLSNFVRITAGAVGTSVSTTVWERRASLHHAQLVENITDGSLPTELFLKGVGASGLDPTQALAQLDRLVNQQAYMLAANDVFYASAALFLLLIPLVWLADGPQNGAGQSGAAAASGAH
ncbi:DHA2 family efflux MFS transporter permease subunit [Lampropedia puyangensis]|uniref:DHA2 family efflux MFS transporter permease subunit n=1 Tax=Lampropedia puyangensis TaxID=1330072 RepID=A0A4S8FAX2_9BURK|nr:DHA2 family efflux MFS transporter permease subunit [Lampropedia puyangensis]THU04131.1 DHA2 family efflux MFS transporter permease subunit [Lampropedia puyangensis]